MKRYGTFHQLYFHFVWATQDRLPIITPEVESRLFPYIGAKCKEWGYGLYAVNGIEDHLHILVELTPTMLIADVARNLKGASSHYINKESGLGVTLYWQDGYGVVSIRKDDVPKVATYIRQQKEHHASRKLSDVLERITL
ncbi:MAG: IS200/IS605 family transposase [Anaerolineae bacterium]|nr:IS200/IS605 family transposase [Anaerolineae bacterium]